MPLSSGQVLVNRYRIVHLLAQGGMGAVYRAWDLSLKKAVALKENFETSTAAREQFEREARILANLNHPNLPRVTDHFFIPDQGHYLVMDYIEGEDLETILDRSGPLSEDQTIPWMIQICDALAYVHNQPSPVIHRDIKPANIKINSENRAILVDFGIAKLYGPTLVTLVGAKAVTPGYSPPEQYSGSTDARSDIYSLGATLYTLLTGEILPDATTLALGKAFVSPPRKSNPAISLRTERAILRAIEPAPENRFQKASELKEALQTESQPTVMEPIHPIEPPMIRTEIISGEMPVPQVRPEFSKPQKERVPWMIIGLGGIGVLVLIMILVFGFLYLNRSSIVAESSLTPTETRHSDTQSPSIIPTATALSLSNPPTPTPAEALFPTSVPPTQPPPVANQPPILHLDQNYNCRGGTNSDFDIIWTFQTGSDLEIIGRSPNGWWLIRINDPRTRRQQCWISGGQPSGNIDSVPITDWTGTVDTAKTPWP